MRLQANGGLFRRSISRIDLWSGCRTADHRCDLDGGHEVQLHMHTELMLLRDTPVKHALVSAQWSFDHGHRRRDIRQPAQPRGAVAAPAAGHKLMLLSRLRRAMAGRSASEILRLIAKNLVYGISRLLPGARRAARADQAFDRRWGTDTSGTRDLSSLSVDIDLARHAVRYQPSNDEWLDSALARLALPLRDYAFVDYGAGKGRVLLAASLHRFREIVGVEFSSELCAIAGRNIEIFAQKAKIAVRPRVVCSDARMFDLPAGPLVCYFYNPFDDVIMADVIARLEASLDAEPRDIAILYVDPKHRRLFEATGRWRVAEDNGFALMLRPAS
jgi:hypothetical protein